MKLKLQYFGHLMQRTDSLEKTLMLERLKAGGEGDDRGWDSWMASPSEFEHAPGAGDGQGSLACCSPWGPKELDRTEWLNWTELNICWCFWLMSDLEPLPWIFHFSYCNCELYNFFLKLYEKIKFSWCKKQQIKKYIEYNPFMFLVILVDR